MLILHLLLHLFAHFFFQPPQSMTAHVFTVNHITALPTISPPLNQSNRLPGILNFELTKINHLTLKIASAQVVESSVKNNSPSQDSNHPDDHFQSTYVTPGFKPFS